MLWVHSWFWKIIPRSFEFLLFLIWAFFKFKWLNYIPLGVYSWELVTIFVLTASHPLFSLDPLFHYVEIVLFENVLEICKIIIFFTCVKWFSLVFDFGYRREWPFWEHNDVLVVVWNWIVEKLRDFVFSISIRCFHAWHWTLSWRRDYSKKKSW